MKSPSPLLNSLHILGLVLVGGVSFAATNLKAAQPAPGPIKHVIHISVDGLRPDAVDVLGPDRAPNFHRLRAESAFTENARTDYDSTETVPNHTTQITGRGVRGDDGHGWTENASERATKTLHENKGSYLSSVFDVVHDHGLRTAAMVAKPKLLHFELSYKEAHGGPDRVGEDNGTKKIDRHVYDSGAPKLMTALLNELKNSPAYVFLHFREPDRAGHDHGWSLDAESPYIESVQKVDVELGRLFKAMDEDPALKAKTTVILTSDHGGQLGTKRHDNAADPQNYIIPLYVWGAGVVRGDLYKTNEDDRRDPGADRPDYAAQPQPIRNGEVSNLALSLLGLPAIPGSTINADQSLSVAP